MSQAHKIVVLKFGHSILKDETDISVVIAEAYLYLRAQYKIFLVVSALGNTTNELLDHVKNIFPDGIIDAPNRSRAELLASGEIISSNLVSIGFNQAGIKSYNLNQSVLKTTGDILDSDPISLDVASVNQLFDSYDVLVLPGFIGVNSDNQVTLLGRGGSDFSAVFAAHNLSAEKCVLYKDSNGIVDDITLVEEQQKIYSHVTYEYCLALPYPVVQHKALKYACDHQEQIIIKNIYSQSQSIVSSKKEYDLDYIKPIKKTRVVILGLGTVGLGVFHKLLKNSKFFEVVGIAVKNLNKHDKHGINAGILSTDTHEILSRDYDILIELVGGTIAKEFILTALKRQKHVVTANKLVVAEAWDELHTVAKENKVSLKYSAAVAGVIPVLETIINLRKNDIVIAEVSGILNGTSNFILGNIDKGFAINDAIKDAQKQGYAESDPTLDINGMDALYKINIISRLSFDREPYSVSVQGLEEIANLKKDNNKSTKLVATSKIIDNKVVASVQLLQLDKFHKFSNVLDANNCVIIKTKDGQEFVLEGRGAGRWPTAVAVYADILDLNLKGDNYA